jgi:hypothetical protein
MMIMKSQPVTKEAKQMIESNKSNDTKANNENGKRKDKFFQ